MELNIPVSKKIFLRTGFVVLVAAITFTFLQKTAFAFVLDPWKWATNTVTYDPHLLPSTWITIANDSKQPWNDATPSPFTFVRDDASANDLIWSLIDGDGRTQARVFQTCTPSPCAGGSTLVRATMQIDSNDTWHTNATCLPIPATRFDGRDVVTHEFGHMATLRHSTCPAGPTMCGTSVRDGTSQSCARRTLQTDDLNGLNTQYP